MGEDLIPVIMKLCVSNIIFGIGIKCYTGKSHTVQWCHTGDGSPSRPLFKRISRGILLFWTGIGPKRMLTVDKIKHADVNYNGNYDMLDVIAILNTTA